MVQKMVHVGTFCVNVDHGAVLRRPPRDGSISNEVAAVTKKQSSDKMSKLASQVLSGAKKPTPAESRKLAGSVLGQDEKKGKRK